MYRVICVSAVAVWWHHGRFMALCCCLCLHCLLSWTVHDIMICLFFFLFFFSWIHSFVFGCYLNDAWMDHWCLGLVTELTSVIIINVLPLYLLFHCLFEIVSGFVSLWSCCGIDVCIIVVFLCCKVLFWQCAIFDVVLCIEICICYGYVYVLHAIVIIYVFIYHWQFYAVTCNDLSLMSLCH